MYCISRVAIITQSRPISRSLGCWKQTSNLVKVPVLLSNPNSLIKVTSLNKSSTSSVKFYKPHILVKLIDTDDKVICETTYGEAKQLALKKNMKLFDMESNPKGKVVEFKLVTGEEYYNLKKIAKKEKREMKEAEDKLKMKIMRLRSSIMENDVNIKMKKAMENLKQGHPTEVILHHKKKFGPEEREIKEKELIDIISEKHIGNEGILKLSDKPNVLCYIYPNDYKFK